MIERLQELGYECVVAFEIDGVKVWNISGYGLLTVVEEIKEDMLASIIESHVERERTFHEDSVERMKRIMKSMPQSIE
jgi:hypothetical protein